MMVTSSSVWSAGAPLPTRLSTGEIVSVEPSAELQAEYVVKLYTRAAALGLQGVNWYPLADGSIGEQRGLVTSQLEPKPAFWAYRNATLRLEGTRPLGQLPAAPVSAGAGELEAYQFATRDSGRLTAAWLSGTLSGTLDLELAVRPETREVEVLDRYGRVEREMQPVKGRVTVEVTTAPVYVVEIPILRQRHVQLPHLPVGLTAE
ncbi:MAG: hypothetical protein HY329_14025 [Chloroflexi bacterium]|nr:hypothetical protein [Chloroflexota bacterium]